MKNLKSVLAVLMVAATVIGTAATRKTTTKKNNNNSKSPSIGMANPASVFCEKHGGKSINVKDKDGNETGKCQFKDGTKVDEWDYYRENN